MQPQQYHETHRTHTHNWARGKFLLLILLLLFLPSPVIDRWKQTLNSTKFTVTSSSVASFPSSTVPTTIISAINSNSNYSEITSASSKRKYTKDTMITNYQEHTTRKQQSVKRISSSSSSSTRLSLLYTSTCLQLTVYTLTLFLHCYSMYHSPVKWIVYTV